MGPVLLAGGITLALLVLPVVIIVAREAIRAVPPSIREGSLALGATQWQTIWKQVLPGSIAGIATGVILALSRAIGETAPLLVVGAGVSLRFNPDEPRQRLHRAADPDLRLDAGPEPGVRGARGRSHLRADDHPAGDELRRHLASQSIRAEVVEEPDMPEHLKDEEAVVEPAVEERRFVSTQAAQHAHPVPAAAMKEPIFDVRDVAVFYGDHRAVTDITFSLARNQITALIGPSGCGKSTFIRCLNRMNDLIPSARVEGQVIYHDQNLYDDKIDPVQVRKRIGMVFQKPNPFPKSIYDNIAFGPRVMGMKGEMDEIVENALRRAALWDDVKDRLKTNAFGMSGGQQQRLCIARALATEPDVLLMDEPCSALDPISTGRIEDLMMELKADYSIVIVTHNMQQAARVSDMTAFFTVELDAGEKHRTGRVVEYAATDKIFTNPDDKRTEDYVTGKVG